MGYLENPQWLDQPDVHIVFRQLVTMFWFFLIPTDSNSKQHFAIEWCQITCMLFILNMFDHELNHGPAFIAFHCSHLYITNPGSVSHFAKTWVSIQTTTYINKSTKYLDILLLLRKDYFLLSFLHHAAGWNKYRKNLGLGIRHQRNFKCMSEW